MDPSAAGAAPDDEQLLFTVATVWREERVSCPHPDLLGAFLDGSLDPAAAEFVGFHLDESQCPYCNATVEELREREAASHTVTLDDLRDRLLRSTVAALRESRGRR
ncbi:MAG: hypothetical protein IPM29_18790 [Planctomycetes bacterium]|nr:hypothetical protein [Planctomycetota bacterium]